MNKLFINGDNINGSANVEKIIRVIDISPAQQLKITEITNYQCF
jgi:hypothetical protein